VSSDVAVGVRKSGPRDGAAGVILVVATVGLIVEFCAWALISPFGAVAYRAELGLTVVEQFLLVAPPVLVGSLGRTRLVRSRTGAVLG